MWYRIEALQWPMEPGRIEPLKRLPIRKDHKSTEEAEAYWKRLFFKKLRKGVFLRDVVLGHVNIIEYPTRDRARKGRFLDGKFVKRLGF